jgi:hypothetical protein
MVSQPIEKDSPEPEASGPLTAADRALVDQVPASLAAGLDLLRWWGPADAQGSYAKRFPVIAPFNLPDTSYGFFGEAPVDGKPLPVMGVMQEQLFDQPKSPRGFEKIAAEWLRSQVEEFVLRYFMRVSSFAAPQAYVDPDRKAPTGLLGALSWCPGGAAELAGFGYKQIYYKRADGGEVGKFAESEQSAIVDLREIGPKYEWLMAKVSVFDFNFTLSLPVSESPQLVVPLKEESYLILSRDFIANDTKPEQGVLGRYGLGYAFLRVPGPSLVAYGPGQFVAASQTIQFKVMESGEVRVCMVFVVNRPDRIVNLSFNPLEWGRRMADWMSFGVASKVAGPLLGDLGKPAGQGAGVDPVLGSIALANLLSGGLAARELCISKEQLEKVFLVKHYMQHYQTITGALMTWRAIADWLDAAALPEWVVRGGSA